jgi:hypothetical protein
MQRHRILYRRYGAMIRLAHDKCVLELKAAVSNVRDRYYEELMDHENGGYGYMLNDDEIGQELDDCICNNPRLMLDEVNELHLFSENDDIGIQWDDIVNDRCWEGSEETLGS